MEPPQAGDRGGLPPIERFGGQDDIGGPNCAAANRSQSDKALLACSGDPKTRPCYLCPWFLGVKWSLSALGLMSSRLGPKYKVKADTKVLTGRARGALQLRTQTKTAFPPSSPAARRHRSPAFSGALPWALEGSLPVLPPPRAGSGHDQWGRSCRPFLPLLQLTPLAGPSHQQRATGERQKESGAFPSRACCGTQPAPATVDCSKAGLGSPSQPLGKAEAPLAPLHSK